MVNLAADLLVAFVIDEHQIGYTSIDLIIDIVR